MQPAWRRLPEKEGAKRIDGVFKANQVPVLTVTDGIVLLRFDFLGRSARVVTGGDSF